VTSPSDAPELTYRGGVVVAVDGSPAARVAADWAARDAALRRVPLTVVHIIAPLELGPWVDFPLPDGFWDERRRCAREIVDDALKVVHDALTDMNREILVDHRIVEEAVVPTLVRMSRHAQLIVVGSRGLGGVKALLLGSVSSGVLYRAHCPVAVIHDEDPLMDHPAQAPVAVGIDGSPASWRATELAFDEASRRGVGLVAVHTWMNRADFDVEVPSDAFAVQADANLAEQLAGYGERYPDVVVQRVVAHDNPVHRLLAESERCQLVVVGSHGRGGFRGMLLGSVSTQVAQSARMPVIVARPENG